jgi:hypothetical protein
MADIDAAGQAGARPSWHCPAGPVPPRNPPHPPPCTLCLQAGNVSSIPMALLGSVLISGIFYIILSLGLVMMFPTSEIDPRVPAFSDWPPGERGGRGTGG